MAGINAKTGKRLDGIEHIRQSIADIITTPIGTRVMRREYGSLVPELLDMPMTDALLMQVYAAMVIAVSRWEPRIKITGTRRNVSTTGHGIASIELIARMLDGQPITASAPIIVTDPENYLGPYVFLIDENGNLWVDENQNPWLEATKPGVAA
ncbi:GPW/gp25 family protein [Vreelandella profundi]|uniref:GPW/gp25 family protein n=1 Tax=Vreelandella profundi TaxID=2852117 RepID=UPI001F313682|nr:GPW/gp25 family protein [Halomonas profundi]